MTAITQNRSADALIAAGEVADLRFHKRADLYSVRAGKLFHCLIAHANGQACEDVEHEIRVADLGFNHTGMQEILSCLRQVMGCIVELRYQTPEGDKITEMGPLLAEVRSVEATGGDGVIRYRLSGVLRRVLSLSKHWAVLSRQAVLSFESKYALRLYEIITLRGGLTRKTAEDFEIAELRQRLGVPDGKLARWADLRRMALEPAIKEVNECTALRVSYEVKKRGRSVVAVSLSWETQEAKGRAKLEADLRDAGAVARGEKPAKPRGGTQQRKAKPSGVKGRGAAEGFRQSLRAG